MHNNSSWILLLAKDNLRLTQGCLASALAQSPRVPVLVVNNASTDGTGTWTRSQKGIPGLWVSSFREPRSVAQAWNLGLDWIWSMGGERVLVLNNDTEIRPDMVERLASGLREIIGLTTGVSVRSREEMAGQGPWEVSDHPDMSGYMITRETHERVRFDERFLGAYCEDLDWHARAWIEGIRVQNTGVPFYHVGSGTIKGSTAERQRAIASLADANREKFFLKWSRRVETQGYDDLFTPERFGSKATCSRGR